MNEYSDASRSMTLAELVDEITADAEGLIYFDEDNDPWLVFSDALTVTKIQALIACLQTLGNSIETAGCHGVILRV